MIGLSVGVLGWAGCSETPSDWHADRNAADR